MMGLQSVLSDVPTPFAWSAVDPGSIVAYAQQRTVAADNYVYQLGLATANMVPPNIEANYPSIEDAPNITFPTPPAFQDVVWVAPAMPAAFTEQLDIGNLLPEPFDDDPPNLAFPAAPAALTDVMPAAPGISLDFEYPEVNFTLPAAPSLLTISVGRFGGVNLPTFDDDIPELAVVAPDIQRYQPGELYTSALLRALQDSLRDRIVNGGTGLPPDVENAIWDRGREREVRQAADAIADLERMEAMGFALPPGAYLDARLKIQIELANAAAGHSREVMIKQAELEQENIKHALTNAVELEGKLMDYTNAVEQRIFESCKYVTEAGIALYTAKVEAYKAYLQAFQAKVEVFKARIQAEMAKVEVYKTEIEAEKIKAEINTALIEQYKAQIQAALANIEVFKAKVDIIRTKAEIEKTKVEIFGEQVRAYSAKIGAYTAGVEAYKATIQAEGVKQEVYKSRVESYTAQVNAATKVIEAKIEGYKANLQANTVLWEGYKAQLQGETARVGAITQINSSLADLYKAEVSGMSSYNEALIKKWASATEIATKVAEAQISVAKANAELYVTVRSLAMESAKVGAQVAAQLGSAAINAINFSQSASQSVSTSHSYSQSYNYNYEN